MSISLKDELEAWAAALKAYDEQNFEKALDLFSCIADSSKILTNMGLIYATIGEHETAVEHFIAATNLDSYLAIAHFQCGVSNFLIERYDFALLNFEDAFLYLRGNEAINYEQIGLKFKLFSAEILFNKGLTQLHLGYTEQGLADMQEASRQKVTDEHGVIDDALRDRGEGYTVFSIPVGVLYRPAENKLKNSRSKDYLGKAKLVAASDSNDAFTEFTGVKKLQQAAEEKPDKNKDAENKTDVELSPLDRSATVPAFRTEPIMERRAVLERSKTTVQPGVGIRPDVPTILASRRVQSVSNPVIVPPQSFASDLSRNNTTQLARNGTTNPGIVTPLRIRTPQGIVGGVVGVGAGGTRAAEETGAVADGLPAALRNRRPSLRRVQTPERPQVAPQSAIQPPPLPLQPGQYMDSTQGQSVSSLMLPASPTPGQGGGHLTQFYDTYIDVYADDPAPRSAVLRAPAYQTQPNGPLSQRQSPASSSFYRLPQPHPQEQELEQQFVPWSQSQFGSLVRTSSNTNSSSGPSRISPRSANAGMVNPSSDMGMGMNQKLGMGVGMNVESNMSMHQNTGMGKGGISNAGGGTLRRKPTRRQTTRRVTMYDDEEGDEGFNDTYEMANIRVKLHYQGDVRGMTIPPTTPYDEFVERVTTKFGAALTGLGMKFMDEEGTKISLRDESDFELAIQTARESAKERSEGKIEVWCVDV